MLILTFSFFLICSISKIHDSTNRPMIQNLVVLQTRVMVDLQPLLSRTHSPLILLLLLIYPLRTRKETREPRNIVTGDVLTRIVDVVPENTRKNRGDQNFCVEIEVDGDPKSKTLDKTVGKGLFRRAPKDLGDTRKNLTDFLPIVLLFPLRPVVYV